MLNFSIIGTLLFLACSSLFAGEDEYGLTKEDLKELKSSYQKPKEIPFPKNNEYTHEKYELGKKLFFDPRLSGSGFISCASCHNPMFGWEDGLDLGLGHGMKKLKRHTPTLLNLAWGEFFFWDGRAKTLEEQALGPIGSKVEMNMPIKDLEWKLAEIQGYVKEFANVFPDKKITKENIAKAIATFERTIVSEDSTFDKWLKGDANAISESAKRGFEIFNTKANCFACHSTWRFTDDSFHDIGIKTKDIGRYEIKKEEKTKFAFKTPTLRNITKRAPYMHNGSKKSLEEVIELYNKGGEVKRKSVSDEISPLNLTNIEKEDLINFLKTLETDESKVILPILPI